MQGSSEVDAAGDPYGFPAPTTTLHVPATSVLFSTQMTQNRSREQLQELVVSCSIVTGAWPLSSHQMQLFVWYALLLEACVALDAKQVSVAQRAQHLCTAQSVPFHPCPMLCL